MLAPALAAQQEDPLRISVTTRLVQVSVVVLDGKGRPANGLTKDDFTVLDNGKPQVITGFFRSGGEPAATAPAPRDPAAPPTWSNRGQSAAEMPRTVTALIFDGLNTNMKDQSFVKEKMLRFLRNLREGDSAALYLLSTDLRILHDFTSDAKSLIASLEDLQPKMLAQWTRETVSGGTMRGILRKDRASFTLSALRAIGEHLSRIPGRKNLVWVTSGFPMLIAEREKNSPGYMHSMIPEMQATAKAIGDADVALYPISAMGLVGVPQISAAQGATRGFGRGRTVTQAGPEITNSRQTGPFQDMMIAIAEPTGGRAFFERNDLDVVLRETMKDLACTYTLSFQPSHGEWNGEYRRLRVQLGRKGLKARHRPGYVASPDGPVDSRDADAVLMDAIDNPLDSTGIGLTVAVEASEGAEVKLRIRIDAKAITLEPAQDRWQGKLLVAVVPEPAEEAMGQPDVQRLTVDLSRERYNEVAKDGATVTRTIAREAYARGIRVFVADVASRRVGSVNVRPLTAAAR